MSDENEKTKVFDIGEQLKNISSDSEQENHLSDSAKPVDPSKIEDKISEALKHIPTPEQDEVMMVNEVSLDDLSDEEFLALYGSEDPKKEKENPAASERVKKKTKKRQARESEQAEQKPVGLDALSDQEFEELYGVDEEGDERIAQNDELSGNVLKKRKSLLDRIRGFYHNINDEELDDDSARTTVKIIGITAGIVFIVIVAGVAFFIHSQYNSYGSQFQKAVAYEQQGDTAKAASCYEKAIASASSRDDKIEGRMALANLYLSEHSDTNAAYYLEQIVDIQSDHIEAISKLLEIYEANNDLTSILALAKKTEGEEAKELFSNYLLNQPVFNYKSGTYNELITVEIEAGESEKIYYTTDGSEATSASMLYTGPITLEVGTTVFHAMAENHNGLLSENIVVTYEIVPDAPDKPEILLDSGEYREPQSIEIAVADGCRAYYTFDGTLPTAESQEYTEPVNMPLGNHIFSVVQINQNGLASDVATRVYDFIYSTTVTKSEAINIVEEALVANGVLTMEDDAAVSASYGEAVFACDFVITINGTEYYRVEQSYEDGGPSGLYAVQIDTGAVFALASDAYENYELLGI